VGTMVTRDGRWRVVVGGVGSVTWYRLVGPDVARNLPSLTALMAALDEVGVGMGELREVQPAA
jgi:hypothetical protein